MVRKYSQNCTLPINYVTEEKAELILIVLLLLLVLDFSPLK